MIFFCFCFCGMVLNTKMTPFINFPGRAKQMPSKVLFVGKKTRRPFGHCVRKLSVACVGYLLSYKGNKGKCKESTIRGHRKKSEPLMGFEPSTLRGF